MLNLPTLRERHGKDTATRKYVYDLFPYGYGQQACKIAGMRKPLKLLLDLQVIRSLPLFTWRPAQCVDSAQGVRDLHVAAEIADLDTGVDAAGI